MSNLYREILQAKLLSAIFNRATKNELLLKGGMAMQVAQKSSRKTKDIDLGQSPEIPLQRLQKVMRSAIKQALGSGILKEYKVSEPKQTDTTARWKINGYTASKTKVQLTVEISRRGIPSKDFLETVEYTPPDSYNIPSVMVDTYNGQALAATKVMALLDKNRTAPRDLYDLYILIRNEIQPPVELLSNIGEENINEALQEIWDKIDMLDYQQFKNEALPYLPAGVADRIDEDVYEDMRLEVGEHVEKWLNETKEYIQGMSP